MHQTKSEARMQTLVKWILGHAVEACGGDNEFIRFRVGEHEFEDKREEYPSEKLIANLALTVDAMGYPPSAFSIDDFGPEVIRSVLHAGRYYVPDEGGGMFPMLRTMHPEWIGL